MAQRRLPLCILFASLMTVVARATTVIPPTFDSLVSSANTIFVGEVMNVRSVWIAGPRGRAIVTDVTFKVEDVWKGAVGAVTQLEFLGGTIGDTRMEVAGMPEFLEGQRSVLFVSSQVKAISPLVGFSHGRMRIEKDPYGVDRVRPADVGAQRVDALQAATPMRLTDLATAVRGRVLAARVR
jgi:hypothetical protein